MSSQLLERINEAKEYLLVYNYDLADLANAFDEIGNEKLAYRLRGICDGLSYIGDLIKKAVAEDLHQRTEEAKKDVAMLAKALLSMDEEQ